jgi:TetR/AcrR family transcriptional repressor of nem operon
LVRDSVGARPRHAALRIAAAGAIATMVGSIVLARAVGDKRLSVSLLEAGRQALHHQAARASAGACPARSI